jgi:hypothetical protein
MKTLKWLLLAVLLLIYGFYTGKAPLMLNAINTTTETSATYEDFNFNRAFFNQYTSLLSLEIVLSYPSALSSANKSTYENSALCYQESSSSSLQCWTTWTRPTNSSSRAELDNTFEEYITDAFFGRNFNSSTNKAERYPFIRFNKPSITGRTDDIILTISFKSRIRYQIAPADALLSFSFDASNVDDKLYFSWDFLSDDTYLGTINVPNYTNDQAIDTKKYGMPIVYNNVNRYNFNISITNPTGIGNNTAEINEFNFFAETPIRVPDDADDSVFGIEFVAVEWWDILGHFNNFIWWIIAKSPISPFFIWINDYVVAWVEQVFNIFEEIFNL